MHEYSSWGNPFNIYSKGNTICPKSQNYEIVMKAVSLWDTNPILTQKNNWVGFML